MKITDIDKRRAIKRLPEFKKAYARHNKLRTEDKITQFKIDFLKKWGYEFEAILYADDVAKYRQDTPTIEAILHYPSFPALNMLEGVTDAPYSYTYKGEEKTPSRLFGDCLYLKVTLKGKTETQLVEDFKRTIKPYRDLLEANSSKERNRKTDITAGIWAIYDLNLKTNKNMSETTRQWFKVSGNPAPLSKNDGFNEKLFKQIKKAVSNANDIINAVRGEYDLK